MVRYYGIYAQHTKERPRLIKMVNDKIKELRMKMRKWRIRIIRIMKSFGYDPLDCEKCGGKMTAIDIYYKEYGSVMEIHRKRIEAEANKKVGEIEYIDKVIRQMSDGRLEPLFV